MVLLKILLDFSIQIHCFKEWHYIIYIYIHTYIHIYIYIVIHRQICFVLSELISVARHTSFPIAGIETRLTQMPIQDFTPQPWGAISCEVNFKWLLITISIVYIHPFNGYRDLNSYMKSLAQTLMATGLLQYIYNQVTLTAGCFLTLSHYFLIRIFFSLLYNVNFSALNVFI